MADDFRSTMTRPPRKRILLVVNPDDQNDPDEEEENDRPSNLYTAQQPYHAYQSHQATSPSTLSPPFELPSRSHIPHPLTTNLPDRHQHRPSSRSNPALSSPSSTSSPAVESTPPPSTPGQSVVAGDLTGDAVQRPELLISSEGGSQPSRDCSNSRSQNIFDKLKSVPHMVTRSGRRASGQRRPATSPSVLSPRSATADKVSIFVTTDSDNYKLVDITGAKDPAFIRERIYTHLQITDEDQPYFSIYQTDIGAFALGDSLTDDQLFDLCRRRGDSQGTLKFFVSHSSARVHDISSGLASPIAMTITPPVLPSQNYAYSPKRDKGKSRSRFDSASSTSEPMRADVAAGYEPSVSDDLDEQEGQTNRSTIRPPARQPSSIFTAQGRNSSSPYPGRGPFAAYPVSGSPVKQSSRPLSPSEMRNRTRAADLDPLRIDRYGGSGAPISSSPNASKYLYQDESATLPHTPLHTRTASDAAAERERALQESETQLEMMDRIWQKRRDDKENKERGTRRYEQDKDRREKFPENEQSEVPDRKIQGDPWVVVPHDVPSTSQGQNVAPTSQGRLKTRASTAHDLSRSSPGGARAERDRRHKASTSPHQGPSGSRLPIPHHPRNPPPPPPVGAAEPRTSSGRHVGQAVPKDWMVSYNLKGPGKADQRPTTPMTSMASNRLLATKSMGDIGGAFRQAHNSIPTSLVPGRRSKLQLPFTNVVSSSTHLPGDLSAAAQRESTSTSNIALQKSYEPLRGGAFSPTGHSPRRPLPPLTTSQASRGQPSYSGQPATPSGNYPGLLSPSQDAYARPQSALGDSMSLPPYQRYPRNASAPMWSESDSPHEPDNWRSRPAAPSNLQYSARHVHGGSKEEVMTDQAYSNLSSKSHMNLRDRVPDVYGGLADSSNVDAQRSPPRSPISPLSPRRDKRTEQAESPGGFSEARATGHDDGEESLEGTAKQGEHDWIGKLLDGVGRGPESTIIPPALKTRERSNASQHPLPPIPPIPPPPPSLSDSTIHSFDNESTYLDNSGDSYLEDRSNSGDSGEEGTGLWKRPPLTVQTHNFPPPPPPPPKRAVSKNHTPGRRVSIFISGSDDTWAVRPPPEDVYERLEEFFPGHDLDKPVIDSSGGTSPITNEHLIPIPPEPPERRSRHKKSIRVVAAEHKKKIDRTSRMESSSVSSNMRRHRSTKLWDSKTEEVTAEKLRSSAPESPSPSGGPKPIFKWVRGELIGKGTYGRVYLALNATTGEMIAVKQVEIPRTASDKNDTRQVTFVQALKQESETLKDLDHPHIVQYLGFEETPTHLSIFLEYVPGGSIASCLKKHGKFDEDVTKSFTGQILDGLEYLHSKGILHRDLKADNILVETSGVCKISDFGISKRTNDVNANGQFTAMQGSVFWMAPEVINSKEKGYNSKIDIWSVGCVVLEMWAGERPWSSEEMVSVMFKLYGKASPPVPRNVHLSPLADDFRRQCFAIDPEERPTAPELRKHPYLKLPSSWGFNGFK